MYLIETHAWEFTRLAEEILELGLEDKPEPLDMYKLGEFLKAVGVDLQMLVNEALFAILLQAHIPVEEAYKLIMGEDG